MWSTKNVTRLIFPIANLLLFFFFSHLLLQHDYVCRSVKHIAIRGWFQIRKFYHSLYQDWKNEWKIIRGTLEGKYIRQFSTSACMYVLWLHTYLYRHFLFTGVRCFLPWYDCSFAEVMVSHISLLVALCCGHGSSFHFIPSSQGLPIELADLGSNPSWVIPKTWRMVFLATLLASQHWRG